MFPTGKISEDLSNQVIKHLDKTSFFNFTTYFTPCKLGHMVEMYISTLLVASFFCNLLNERNCGRKKMARTMQIFGNADIWRFGVVLTTITTVVTTCNTVRCGTAKNNV